VSPEVFAGMVEEVAQLLLNFELIAAQAGARRISISSAPREP
jgi:hypothetical protein